MLRHNHLMMIMYIKTSLLPSWTKQNNKTALCRELTQNTNNFYSCVLCVRSFIKSQSSAQCFRHCENFLTGSSNEITFILKVLLIRAMCCVPNVQPLYVFKIIHLLFYRERQTSRVIRMRKAVLSLVKYCILFLHFNTRKIWRHQ